MRKDSQAVAAAVFSCCLGMALLALGGCKTSPQIAQNSQVSPVANGQLGDRPLSAAEATVSPVIGGADASQHVKGAAPQVHKPEVQLVQYRTATPPQDQFDGAATDHLPEPSQWEGEPLAPGGFLPSQAASPGEVYPIDLPTTLRLAGAGNLQIALAAERVEESLARQDAARVLWIPSFNAGVVYNKHDGRIQETRGEVIEASRNSLFVGGGPVLLNSPLAAGAGPPRLFVDLSVADVLFEPLAARQSVRWNDADRAATFNDTLLEVTRAYWDLLRAQGQLAIAGEALENAEELARLTAEFARTGAGLEADAQRAQAEAASRRSRRLEAEEQLAVSSAELARLLRLDPAVLLFPADSQPIPVTLVDEETPLQLLIEQGVASRPELARSDAAVEETYARLRQEKWRPWTPNLYAGFSSGGFGGGEGSFTGNFGGRSDFDAAAVWELENFGLGNRARQRERESIYVQAQLMVAQTRDLIAAEVTQALARARLRRSQIEAVQSQVISAQTGLQLNLQGIRGAVLRPIEAQQAIQALASARQDYVNAVIGYNQTQAELLRAIGRPLMESQLTSSIAYGPAGGTAAGGPAQGQPAKNRHPRSGASVHNCPGAASFPFGRAGGAQGPRGTAAEVAS